MRWCQKRLCRCILLGNNPGDTIETGCFLWNTCHNHPQVYYYIFAQLSQVREFTNVPVRSGRPSPEVHHLLSAGCATWRREAARPSFSQETMLFYHHVGFLNYVLCKPSPGTRVVEGRIRNLNNVNFFRLFSNFHPNRISEFLMFQVWDVWEASQKLTWLKIRQPSSKKRRCRRDNEYRTSKPTSANRNFGAELIWYSIN